MSRTLLAFSILLPLVAWQALGDEPPRSAFHDLSFDQAIAKAGQEKKLVMVDFYTTWCGPCKMLDKQTWTDEAVIKWLKKQTVAIKIDAEKQRDLAARYKIRAYPSMVLINPDRTEKGRIVGFKRPKEFLRLAADVLAGVKPADRIRQQLAKDGRNDPMQRARLGDELAREGKYEEALAEYLWCFDHGLEHSQGYFGVRLSFLLGRIHRLARQHPAALDELRKRRDQATDALLSGKGTFLHAMDMSAINRELDENERTLKVYDTLREAGKLDESFRPALFGKVLDLLLEARRYQDILDGVGDVDAAVERKIVRFQFTKITPRTRGAGTPDALEYLRRSAVDDGVKYYEALLGTKRGEEAALIAERLIEFDATGETVAALITHAIRAGAPDAARQVIELGLEKLPESEHEQIRKAAKQLP